MLLPLPPLHLQISEETYDMLPPEQQAVFEQRESVEVKGKGIMRTYITSDTSTALGSAEAAAGAAAGAVAMNGVAAGPTVTHAIPIGAAVN